MGDRLNLAKKRSGDHYGLNVAAAVIEEALSTMEPEGVIAINGTWEQYTGQLRGILGGQPVDMEGMMTLRSGMEYLSADSSEAEFLICSVKVALSAMMLGMTNPFSMILSERSMVHDDIDPLVRKAVALFEAATDVQNGDFSVSYDEGIVQTFQNHFKKNMMGALIDNAIRPGDPRNN